jgi:tetratricopeptide (TPR) repeat protein
MLAPELREFFARLSVFPHTWDLDAAEAILEAPLAMDWLAQLRECSLLYSDEEESGTGAMRYRMLETVRAYAHDRLSEQESLPLRKRHAEFYRAKARLAASGLSGQGHAMIAAILRAEEENFRAAIDCYLNHGEPDSAAQIALVLVKGWESRGLWDSARLVLRQCLEQDQSLGDQALHARLLGNAGWFAFLQADYQEAAAKIRAGLDLCRHAGDKNGECVALNNLALVTQALGDLAEARRLFEASLDLARELGDSRKQAARLSNLGLLAANEQRFAEARSCLEQAHRIYQRSEDQQGASASLCNLGDLALRMEDWAEAGVVSGAALRLFRQLQDKRGIAYALTNLAESSLQLGDLETMQASLIEALEIALELRLHSLVPVLVEIWARAQFNAHRAEQADYALRAADYLRSSAPEQPGTVEQARILPVREALESTLSPETRSKIASRIIGLSRDELILAILSEMKEPANAV